MYDRFQQDEVLFPPLHSEAGDEAKQGKSAKKPQKRRRAETFSEDEVAEPAMRSRAEKPDMSDWIVSTTVAKCWSRLIPSST